jgi:hypothetical protein
VASNDFNSYKTQTDNAISQRVTSSTFSSYQAQTDSAIQQRVTKEDFLNSAVGANLLTGTKNFSGNWNYIDSWDSSDNWVDPNGNTAFKRTSAWNGLSQPYVVSKDKTYTFSAYYYWSSGSAAYFYPNTSVSGAAQVAQSSYAYVKRTSAWELFTYTFTAVADGEFWGKFELTRDGTLHVGSYKLERGSNATPWCPAASEIANYSQIQQLDNNINLRVQKNDVINQINVSSESILIAGNKVHITGSTTIDNAVIKSAMIDSISADKITAGTLNAANVNVINLNANNISSGTLSGDYISGGTITGVSFHQTSSKHGTWIDQNGIHDYDGSGNNAWIKQGILQVYDNANQGFFMDAGSIKLTSLSNFQTNATDMYGSIERNYNLFDSSTYGMDVIGSNGLVMRTNNALGIKLSSSAMLASSIVGSFIGLSNNGKGVIGLQKSIQLFAGSSYNDNGLTVKPLFYLGTNAWQGEGVDDGSNAYLAGAGITLDAAGSITLSIGHNKRIYWGTNHQDSTDGHSFFTTNSSGYWFWGGDTSSMKQIHVQSVSQTSLLSLKTNLSKLDGATALSALIGTDIYNYNYKSDLKNGISKTYATAVIDDVNDKPQYHIPYDFISADGTGRDDGTILGYAVAAIQELNSKITSLETEIKQLKGAA